MQEANRITKHGDFIVTSDKTRKQILNQGDCLNRLRTMIFDASVLPKEPTPEELELAAKRFVYWFTFKYMQFYLCAALALIL